MSGGGGGGYGGAGGRANMVAAGRANGYEEDWMAKTKETLEKELRYRGIDPAIIAEVVDKVEEPSVAMPVIIGILATALILSFIFFIIWETT